MMGIMLPLACILGEGIPLTVFILCNCLLRINSSFEFRTAAVGIAASRDCTVASWNSRIASPQIEAAQTQTSSIT